MKEAYVTFETAQRLKEKGFDWKVFHFYDEEGHLKHREGDCYSLYNWNYPTRDEYGSQYCSAPTQQMACRWLRETQGLWIIPMPCEDGGCYFKIYKRYGKIWKDNVYGHTDYEDFDEPEDAIEVALEYALTKLI